MVVRTRRDGKSSVIILITAILYTRIIIIYVHSNLAVKYQNVMTSDHVAFIFP